MRADAQRRREAIVQAGRVLVAERGGEVPLEAVAEVAGARLSVARLAGGQVLTVPGGALTHLFVAAGALLRFSLAQPLAAGDAIVLTEEPDHEVTAGVPSELLVWTLPDAG